MPIPLVSGNQNSHPVIVRSIKDFLCVYFTKGFYQEGKSEDEDVLFI